MINNERGFMLLNVVFLTLITSFAAMILMNAAPRIRNPQATLRLTALYLANEQFAMLENKAANGELAAGSYEFLGYKDDLTTINFSEKIPVKFEIDTTVTENGNLRDAAVTVTIKDDKNFKLEAERTILFVPKATE